jgi:GTPase SAR1 family protein
MKRMILLRRATTTKQSTQVIHRCFTTNQFMMMAKYAMSEAVVRNIIERHEKDENGEEDDSSSDKKSNEKKNFTFSIRHVIAGIAGGVLFSASVALWDQIQDFVFSRAEKNLVMQPGTFDTNEERPLWFIEARISEQGAQISTLLSYPLLGEKAAPHLRVFLGPSGCGKSTMIKELLNGDAGVIYVDMSQTQKTTAMFRKIYNAISLVPPTDRSEEFFKDAVEMNIKKQYKDSSNDKTGNSKPYKIIVDSADDILKFHDGVEVPEVVSWLVWLMEISCYANVIIVAADANIERNLNQILQIRSRYTVYKMELFKNRDALLKYVKSRIDHLDHEPAVGKNQGNSFREMTNIIDVGNLDPEKVVDAFRGLFSNYSNLFSLTDQFQNLDDKFNLAVEECKNRFTDILCEFPESDALR